MVAFSTVFDASGHGSLSDKLFEYGFFRQEMPVANAYAASNRTIMHAYAAAASQFFIRVAGPPDLFFFFCRRVEGSRLGRRCSKTGLDGRHLLSELVRPSLRGLPIARGSVGRRSSADVMVALTAVEVKQGGKVEAQCCRKRYYIYIYTTVYIHTCCAPRKQHQSFTNWLLLSLHPMFSLLC